MNSESTDNVITLREFSEFLREELGYIPYNIKGLFEQIDTNNDGRISVQELLKGLKGS